MRASAAAAETQTTPDVPPACTHCGNSANVCLPPLYIEIAGTMDMVAEYFCRDCRLTFKLPRYRPSTK